MAVANVSICVCFVLLVTANLAGGVGINWGREGLNKLVPSAVVTMLMNNKFDKVKLYDADRSVVDAFVDTGIELMVGIRNDDFKSLTNEYQVEQWVEENVTRPINKGVNIKYVAVGNEPFLKIYNTTYSKYIIAILRNVQKHLNINHPKNKIKATIPFNYEVCQSGKGLVAPSEGVFREDIKDLMLHILKELNEHDAPFFVNISPFRILLDNANVSAAFANFSSDEGFTDNNLKYTNVLDANYDMVVSALGNAGFPEMKVVIGEIGWPSDGHVNTTKPKAKSFLQKLLVHIGKGTPLRPHPLEVYLYNLFDENTKSISMGAYQRHWGLFQYDGKPKHTLDFTGQGRTIQPESVKGVQYLPKRWCVLDTEKTGNRTLIGEAVKFACDNADCSQLADGGSCHKLLDFYGNVSFAFNIYFQMHYQKNPDVCTEKDKGLRGLGNITTINPTEGLYPEEDRENGLYGECQYKVLAMSASDRLDTMCGSIVLLALLSLYLLNPLH